MERNTVNPFQFTPKLTSTTPAVLTF